MKPVILLAFANDFERGRILSNLTEEQDQLRQTLRDHFHAESLAAATLDRIEGECIRYGKAIGIFHFGGHADGDKLDIHAAGPGAAEGAFPKGLAGYLGRQGGIKLAFLNGCHTAKQAKYYLDAGIPAVIGATRALPDRIALDFARYFYNSFTHHASGRSIREAYEEAKDLLVASFPELGEGEVERGGLKIPERVGAKPKGFPYQLLTKNGAASSIRYQHLNLLENKPNIQDEPTHLKCDRYDEKEDFALALKDELQGSGRRPFACIVQGDKEEMPLSLCERFNRFSVEEVFRSQDRVLDKSGHAFYEITFPRASDFSKKRGPNIKFRESFKEHLNLRHIAPSQVESLDAQDIIDGLASHQKVVVLQHTLYARDWESEAAQRFLAQYLNSFWNVDIPVGKPEILLLFSMQYDVAGGLGKLFGQKGGKKVEQSLNNLSCTLLGRLPMVKREDVERWFDENRLEGANFINDLFGRKKALHMERILPKLENFSADD
jgi:hypothetical protein